jgi:hypothetical protein
MTAAPTTAIAIAADATGLAVIMLADVRAIRGALLARCADISGESGNAMGVFCGQYTPTSWAH